VHHRDENHNDGHRQHEAQAEATRFYMLEAADVEKEVRLEKMMPAHDLRPMYRRIQVRIDGIQARMRVQGPWAQGPGHFALGRARFMQRDYIGAQAELEQAWDRGFQTPDLAWLLAQTLVATAYRSSNTTIFNTGQPPADAAALAQRAQGLLVRGKAAEGNSPEYAESLLAFLRRDYRQAAASAHAAFAARPWLSEAAAMESLCRSGVGRRLFLAGDFQGAERNYREAMAAAQQYLAIGHSDPFTYHAYLVGAARLGLAQLDRGDLPLARIDELRARCERALSLDPSQQELQDDWIQISLLRARQLLRLGRDPGPELDAALGFLNTWGREPLSAELRADRMLIHFRLAEASFRLTGDPGPDLAEAMKDRGHTLYFRHRDYLGDLLNFRARVQLSQGRDPRPVLADALERMRPQLEQGTIWTSLETAAESWQLRAAWEARSGLDPGPSLQRCRALADQALQLNHRSGPGHALKGMAHVLEAGTRPENRPFHLAQARKQMLLAQVLEPRGRLTNMLRESLHESPIPRSDP